MTKKEMTKKEEQKKNIEAEATAAIIANPLRKAQKGISNRAFGDLFEHCINYGFGLIDRSKVTQKQGKIDCIKYATIDGKRVQVRIEIKQGASPLATLDEDGNIICSEIRKSHFVCYHPRFIPDNTPIETALKECVFFTVDDFFAILEKFNAIRTKRGKTQQDLHKAGLPSYKDVESIQSLYNVKSLTRFNAFAKELYFEGMDFQTFAEVYHISTIF